MRPKTPITPAAAAPTAPVGLAPAALDPVVLETVPAEAEPVPVPVAFEVVLWAPVVVVAGFTVAAAPLSQGFE